MKKNIRHKTYYIFYLYLEGSGLCCSLSEKIKLSDFNFKTSMTKDLAAVNSYASNNFRGPFCSRTKEISLEIIQKYFSFDKENIDRKDVFLLDQDKIFFVKITGNEKIAWRYDIYKKVYKL